jgi:acetyl esterase
MNASALPRCRKFIASASFHAILIPALLAAANSALWAQSDRDLFSRLDADGDGKLTQTELPQAQRPNFARIDANSDGTVSREELNTFRQRPNAPDAPPRQARGTPTRPTHADVSYGPHKRNVLDLYLAESDEPTPLVLYIHGGGFQGGDKNSLSSTAVQSFREAGWSIAAINYRLTDVAPAPAQYLDCARALQFLRHNANTWNIDPERVASTGGSAGAGTSMWLAFHDDLGDPKSDDPVARQSTRLTCIAVSNGQSSYDPRFAERIGIPRPNFERHSFFKPFYNLEDGQFDTPEAYRRYDAAAPITYLTKDDPPVLLQYTYANEDVTSNTPLGLIVHHPKFGVALKDEMGKLGIECLVQYRDPKTNRPVTHGGGDSVSVVQFLRKHFAAAGAQK